MMMKYSANVFALCLFEWTDEEGSGPFAMIIIPSLLALSTLIVVSQIIWSFVTKRSSAQVITGSSSNVNGMRKRQHFEPKCQFIFSFIAWFFWGQIMRNSICWINHLSEGEPVPLDTGVGTLRPAQDALGQWEIPSQCTLVGIEPLQMGRYGPICKGQLKQDNTSTAVVIKTLKGTEQHKSFF